MATIKDIARLSGYSVGTVSRVINQHPDVSAETREKILKIIKEENFQPNSNARLLKQTHASAISVIVKGTDNLFLNSLLEKVQSQLRSHGEEATVIFLKEADNEVQYAVQFSRERNPKGLIFLGGDLENFRRSFEEIDTPAVLVAADASQLDFANLSSFSTDDYAGAREAVTRLIASGHQKIGIIGGFATFEENQVSSQRLQGAIDVMRENGLKFDRKKDYQESIFAMKDGYENTRNLLKKNPKITAIFALSDMIAIGAMRAVHDAGMRVPEDISVIGYDGIEYTRYTLPRLATVRQDIDELARKSVEDLLFRISYPRKAVHKRIPFELIGEDSIAKRQKD